MRRAAVLLALVALAAAGCGSSTTGAGGEGSGSEAERSSLLVDFTKRPPYVFSLDIDPKTKEFLLTTNRGFYRVDPAGKAAKKQTSVASAGGSSSPVGTFLDVVVGEDGRLLGSGHPDDPRKLPQFLGFMVSGDGGKAWQILSRLGDADLHKFVLKHDKLYAWDAVLSAMVISEDGGRTFEEHFTPRGLILDFEVDPEDPETIIISNEEEQYRSTDSGERWRPLSVAKRSRYAWPAKDKLYRATADGTVSVSSDGGSRFKDVGEIPGEPYELKPVGPEELYAAVSDGGILHTTDGGKAWERVFTPR